MNRQEKFRLGLSVLYIPFYDRLCERLSTWLPEQFQGFMWAPYQGLRSFAEQDADYLKGRQGRSGGIVTNARGGESPHQYGCATDWTLFDQDGQPKWIMASHPIWKEFSRIVEGCGLKSGQSFHDPDHAELWIDCSWPHVLSVYKTVNMTAAQEHIKRNIHPAAYLGM